LKTKRQIKEFPDPNKADADLGLDKPSATISIWVDGIKKEEKKTEKKDDKTTEEKKESKDEKNDDKVKDDKKEGKPIDEKKDAKADEKKEEKKEPVAEPTLKEEKPTIKLVFGKKEKDLVFVRREVGSETTRAAVPSTLLEKLSEGKLAYLDRKIPSFAFGADLSKIVLDRPSGIYELEKTKDEKSNTLWKLKQPK